MRHITRRRFVASSTRAAAALGAATLILPGGERARAALPSEKLRIALIGAGGRGSNLANGFASRPDCEISQVCDLDPRRGGDLLKELAANQGKLPERVLEMRRVLDDKSIDAVINATPDHWHALGTILACQAGKHVYVEKPPSHNVYEGRKMVEAARKYKRVVQVGTQNRSAPYNKKALEYIRSGQLGTIPLIKVFNLKSGGPFQAGPDSETPKGVDYNTWLGPARSRPFSESHFHGSWHAWWEYSGGDMADDGIHQLDLARWLSGKELPRAVHAMGGKLAFPRSGGETPDTQVVNYDFGDLLMTFELTGYAPYMDKIAGDIRMGAGFPYWPQCATRIEIYGTKALMFVGRHGGGWQVFVKSKQQSRPGELVLEERGRFPDPEHKQDFVDAIRADRKPNADVEEGHRSATLVHLANIATRLGGRRLEYDAKTESVTNDKEANALLKREGRAPFVIPDRV